MKPLRSRTVIRIATIIVLIYALIGIVYYHAQERILFRGVAVASDFDYGFSIPSQEMMIRHHPGADLHITKFPVSSGIARKGVVIYLHGNRRNVSWYADRVPFFTARGYEVWMPDYPGFGKSTGSLEESLLYEYAKQTYLMARAASAPDSIWVYGRSMGTGVAAWLVSKVVVKGLVLETPYRSIPSLVSTWMPIWPTQRLSKFLLPVEEYLSGVAVPVTILHGTKDRVIPISHAEGLQSVLKPGDRFVSIAGAGHNDLPAYDLYIRVMDSLLIPRE
jgi:pimeloyl-ACP methyl ester carboxylesterase